MFQERSGNCEDGPGRSSRKSWEGIGDACSLLLDDQTISGICVNIDNDRIVKGPLPIRINETRNKYVYIIQSSILNENVAMLKFATVL